VSGHDGDRDAEILGFENCCRRADASKEDSPELRMGKSIKTLLDTPDIHDNKISSILCLPFDHFEFSGPNGSHYCFVYPVLGPKASLGMFQSPREKRDRTIKNIYYQLVQVVDFLHRRGICHGGRLQLDPPYSACWLGLIVNRHYPEKCPSVHSKPQWFIEVEVLQILGQPSRNPVVKIDESGEDDPSPPEYLVYPVDWNRVDVRYITSQPGLIDFGESFRVSKASSVSRYPTAISLP